MSDGIELRSVCCPDNWMVQKEGDYFKVMLESNNLEIYQSHIPVYTCKKCGLKWALERVVSSKPQTLLSQSSIAGEFN